MRRGLHRLSARTVTTAKAGRHADGGGLYLAVDPTGARRWVFIIWRDRKPTEMGLGSVVQGVTLAIARNRAVECRHLVVSGHSLKHSTKSWQRGATLAPTFGDVAAEVISTLESGWRNEKHRKQWHATIKNYCSEITSKSISEITTEDVLKVLKPIWTTKSETASRVRGRLEKILDAAKAKGIREGENPARWRGHLDHLLPKRQKLQRGHHAALSWKDLPEFMVRLREREAVAALALEFTILTAARSGEALGASWSEFDLLQKVWTIPPERMKAGREHRVPLSATVCKLLKRLHDAKTNNFVFAAQRGKKPLSGMAMEMLLRRMQVGDLTVHGFRSTFRDWCGEATNFEREVAEAALAHSVGNAVERAYRRGDALQKRRTLMEAWAQFSEK